MLNLTKNSFISVWKILKPQANPSSFIVIFRTPVGITPIVTQLKGFIASEDSFYGLCHSTQYFCKWHVETSRVSYITESEYNDKFIDMNMVSIVNLDDVILKQTSEPTEDTSLAGNA